MSSRDLHDLAAAYALGAVDSTERGELDALLSHDEAFRRAVDAYREVSGLMALAAPSVPAPGALRERILSDARGVRTIGSAPSARSTRSWMRPVPWLAAAAGLALAVFSYSRLQATRGTMVALSGELTQVRGELAEKERTLSAFMGPEVHVVSLSPADAKPTARVYWNHTRSVFIVTAFNVPRAPDGKTYQLWAIAKGSNPVSMGTFNTDEDGRATLIVPVGTDVGGIDLVQLCAMTLEPSGGSPQPPRRRASWGAGGTPTEALLGRRRYDGRAESGRTTPGTPFATSPAAS